MAGKHNHFAVVAVVLLHQVLGYFWYAPFGFLMPWLTAQGRTLSQLNPGDPGPIVWSFAGNILAGYALSWLIIKLDINKFSDGVMLGLILFTGFGALYTGAHYKFLGISDTVLFIDLGLLGIWTVLAAALLAAWRNTRSPGKGALVHDQTI